MARLPSRGRLAPTERSRAVRLPGPEDVERVRLARDPGVNVPREAFGGGGEALVDVGRSIGNVAQSVERAAEKQQKRFDATATSEALLSFEKAGMSEFQKRQVEDDPSRPDFMSDYDSFLEERADQVLSNLPDSVSDDARERLRIRLLEARQGMTDSAGRLSLKAGQDKAADTIQSLTNKYAAQAGRDPDFLDTILDVAEDDLDTFKGSLTPDAERDLLAGAKETIVSSAIRGLVKKGRYDEAEALLADERFDEVLSQRQRQTLTNAVKSGRSEGLKVERAKVKDLIENDVASVAATGQGNPNLTEERVRKAYGGGEQAEAVVQEWRERRALAQTTHTVSERLKPARPEEMDAIIAPLKPEPGDEDFAVKQRMFDAAVKERDRLLKLREADPAGYVMQFDRVKDSFPAVDEPGELSPTEEFRAALRQRLDVQREIGIRRPRLMSDDELDRMALRIDQSGTADRPDVFLAMQQSYGPLYNRVLRELSENNKIDTANGVLASLANRPRVARELAAALQTGRTELRKGLGPEANEIDEKVREKMQPMAQAALAGGRLGTAERLPALNRISETVSLLAMQRYKINGDLSGSVDSAVEDVINSRFHIGETWYAPTVIDGQEINRSAVETAMDDALTEEAIRAFDPEPFLSQGTVLDDEAKTNAAVEAAKNGFWVTNNDATGAYLAWEQLDGSLAVLRDKDGNRYEIDFRTASLGREESNVVRSRSKGFRGMGP